VERVVAAPQSHDAAFERRFRFFDTSVLVRSDLLEVLGALDAMFAGFAPAEDGHATAAPATSELVCSVLERDGDRAEIRVEGRSYQVERRCDAVGLAYMVLFRAALRRIRSHVLLHAGVVERRGRAVILAGGSGAGKSTLVLELVRRGFGLLSDDVAAIRLSDGRVEPFPRSLGMWAGGPLALEGRGDLEMLSAMPLIGGGEKLLIRPAALGADRIGPACPVALLVILPSGPERQAPGEGLHVVFSALPAGLPNALETLPGVSRIERVANRLFPELRFRTPSAGEALRQIDAACADFGVTILETSRGDTRAVHTSGTPVLAAIGKAEAARALLRHLHVGQDSALIRRTLGGSGARLLLQLARLVDGMQCATLSVGRLSERADRICAALDGSESAA
jgi:hypothetical protein